MRATAGVARGSVLRRRTDQGLAMTRVALLTMCAGFLIAMVVAAAFGALIIAINGRLP
jgi:hypothetical protein